MLSSQWPSERSERLMDWWPLDGTQHYTFDHLGRSFRVRADRGQEDYNFRRLASSIGTTGHGCSFFPLSLPLSEHE